MVMTTRVAPLRVGDAFVDVGGQDGLYFAIELQLKHNGGGRVLLRRGRRKNRNERRDAQGTKKSKLRRRE
jgi:hypothetical protein